VDESSAILVARCRAGDQQAASELFHRYAGRLIALARSRLSAKVAHRVDPEDVIQSVYRSLFADIEAGCYELQRGGDLWRLLVAITLHKLQNQIRDLSAQKRDIAREEHFGSADSLCGLQPLVLAKEPSPVEAVALAELLEQIMHRLDPSERRLLELRFQGYTIDEIAADLQWGERTVRRVLDEIKEQVQGGELGASGP